MNNEKGFVTTFAIITIFSLCVAISSIAIYGQSSAKKIKAYKNRFEAKKEAEELIFRMLEDFQILKSIEDGAKEKEAILEITNKYLQYNFSAKDVSTGINKNFIRKEILESNALKKYLNSSKIQEAEYGWINPKIADEKFIESIKADLETENTFPLVNFYPIYNISEMEKDFIKAILEYEKIPEEEEKLKKLEAQSFLGIDKKILKEILKVSENNAVFNFLGTKTVFWKILFETKQYKVKAIFALVPDKKENSKAEKYILIEKELSFKENAG